MSSVRLRVFSPQLSLSRRELRVMHSVSLIARTARTVSAAVTKSVGRKNSIYNNSWDIS